MWTPVFFFVFALCVKCSTLHIITSALLLDGSSARRYGRWGGTEGIEFSDGESKGIVCMRLWHGEVFDGLQVMYDYGDGQYIWAPAHGTTTHKAPTQICLDYPNEEITQMRGFGGPSKFTRDGINQLTFISSDKYTGHQKSYGPYGITTGQFFVTPVGKFVGFWGFATQTQYFRGIGMYLERPCYPGSSFNSSSTLELNVA
ncbi:hypothetical protein SELMODRAFT_414098 [Selaginella moellendorffii]|uniref:Jacalin-type lectin domain-containing protein n=1 Tax=Selaginella moellendorffii TaxID=88036 RepID=D8RRM6_SELML|nr:hypothetical protein SELMODRAFT_414098 [Selaginella moellendorffii]